MMVYVVVEEKQINGCHLVRSESCLGRYGDRVAIWVVAVQVSALLPVFFLGGGSSSLVGSYLILGDMYVNDLSLKKKYHCPELSRSLFLPLPASLCHSVFTMEIPQQGR